MNTLAFWTTLDGAGFRLMRILLAVLWQSSILLVAVALLVCALRRRRASVRHVLWVGALLVAPAVPLLGWAGAHFGAPRAEIPLIPAYSSPVTFAPPIESPALLEENEAPIAAPVTPPASEEEQVPFSAADYPWAIALLTYMCGLAVFLGFVILWRLHIAICLRRGSPVTEPRILGVFRHAARQLRLVTDFIVVETDGVDAPVTVRTRHPVILLPAGLARSLPHADLRAVAVHELAHIKRRDALLLSLASLVRASLFFHPLVWLACRRISLLAEHAADDAVLSVTGQAVPYAKVLARMAERLRRPALATELAAGIVLSKSSFLLRVEAILSDRRDQIRRLSRWALAATLAGLAVSLLLASGLPLGQVDTSDVESRLCRSHLRGLVLDAIIYRNEHDRWPDSIDDFFSKYVGHKTYESMTCTVTGTKYGYCRPSSAETTPPRDMIAFYDTQPHVIGKGQSEKKVYNVIFWNIGTREVNKLELESLLLAAQQTATLTNGTYSLRLASKRADGSPIEKVYKVQLEIEGENLKIINPGHYGDVGTIREGRIKATSENVNATIVMEGTVKGDGTAGGRLFGDFGIEGAWTLKRMTEDDIRAWQEGVDKLKARAWKFLLENRYEEAHQAILDIFDQRPGVDREVSWLHWCLTQRQRWAKYDKEKALVRALIEEGKLKEAKAALIAIPSGSDPEAWSLYYRISPGPPWERYLLDNKVLRPVLSDAPIERFAKLLELTAAPVTLDVEAIRKKHRGLEGLRVSLEGPEAGISVRNALEQMAKQTRLAWKVAEGAIVISTPEAIAHLEAKGPDSPASKAHVAANNENPLAAPARQRALSFGPVIERFIHDDGGKQNQLIDLDTGKLFSFPDDFPSRDTAAQLEWYRTSGVDAGAETDESVRGLAGVNLTASPLSPDLWDSPLPAVMSAKDGAPTTVLQRYLTVVFNGVLVNQGPLGPPRAVMSAKDGTPATFAFKTRDGGVGILQILEVVDTEPRGVWIRYKLVQAGGVVAPPNEEERARATPEEPSAPKPVGEPKLGMEVGNQTQLHALSQEEIAERARTLRGRLLQELSRHPEWSNLQEKVRHLREEAGGPWDRLQLSIESLPSEQQRMIRQLEQARTAERIVTHVLEWIKPGKDPPALFAQDDSWKKAVEEGKDPQDLLKEIRGRVREAEERCQQTSAELELVSRGNLNSGLVDLIYQVADLRAEIFFISEWPMKSIMLEPGIRELDQELTRLRRHLPFIRPAPPKNSVSTFTDLLEGDE